LPLAENAGTLLIMRARGRATSIATLAMAALVAAAVLTLGVPAARLAASLPSPSTWHPGASSPAYRRHVDTVRRRMDKADFLRRQTG